MIALSGALIIANGSVRGRRRPGFWQGYRRPLVRPVPSVDGGRARDASSPSVAIARDVSWTMTGSQPSSLNLTAACGVLRLQEEIDNLVVYIRSLEPH